MKKAELSSAFEHLFVFFINPHILNGIIFFQRRKHMGKITTENDELLNQALENGIIDMKILKKKLEMKKREKYLCSHPYSIWSGKNGYWYTYLPDPNKQRRMIKKKTKTQIEEEIINFYKVKELDEKKINHDITLLEIFPEWIQFKWKHTQSSSYIKRITSDWERFYQKDTEFINTPLRKFTTVQLDSWAHDTIKKYELTKKAYYNMSIILRQCLDYAVDLKCIDKNVFSEVKITTKLFKRTKKKSGETEVYTMDEEKKLIMDMFRRFNDNPQNTAPLAVILMFEIGVRIGELCALQFSDIEGNYIHIQRQEVRDFEMISSYKMRFKGFKIVEYTKSEDGDRRIYLTDTAKQIIDIVKRTNIKNREKNNSFIFIKNGKNINHYSIQAMILRGCEYLEMLVKTSHKIRKTYISTLIDSGLNIDEIRRMAGHTDERTTYGNYCYNRLTNSQTEEKIENALNFKRVIKGNQIWELYNNQEIPKTQDFSNVSNR